MKQLTEGIYRTTELDDSEQIQSLLLSPQTIARFENEIASLTQSMVDTHFAIGEPSELNRQLAEFLYKQARRETLIALLDDCVEGYNQLANPNPSGD
jgi:hypothetical protein